MAYSGSGGPTSDAAPASNTPEIARPLGNSSRRWDYESILVVDKHLRKAGGISIIP